MPKTVIPPYRKRLAKEKGTIRKDRGGKIGVALIYPNLYRIGMSNLGFQVLYQLFNQREDIVAERFFLPDEDELDIYNQTGKALISLESHSPLPDFDLIAFSLSFENDYAHILTILDLGKIPLMAQERDHRYPLVLAGGINTFLNPEPLALFFDLFLLGEAEANLDCFLNQFIEAGKNSGEKEALITDLVLRTPHLYAPALYKIEYNQDGMIHSRPATKPGLPEKIGVARQPLEKLPIHKSSLLTPETEFPDKILVEVGRGCGRACRFCAAGYVYRPPRYHSEVSLINCLENCIQDCSSFGLLSASLSDSPGIDQIMEWIIKKEGDFSISSIRAENVTIKHLEHLKAAGQKGVTLAPEAGSERLRRVINKHLTNDQIIDSAKLIAKTGDFNLRLYFLIGLPTETGDDIEAIVRLVKSIRHHIIKESKGRGTIGQIRLSINCLVPKPFTPFQWFPLDDVKSLKEKQKMLRKNLSKVGGVNATFDVPKWAYLQALLSLGDRRVGHILLLAHKYKGNWSKAFRHSDVNPDFFVYRSKSFDEVLPWDFIDHGIRKEFLVKESKLALKEEESDGCDVGHCDRCGVCAI